MGRKLIRTCLWLVGGLALIVVGIFLYFRITEPNPAKGPVAPLKQQQGETSYRLLIIEGAPVEPDSYGIYDPSIEYSRDGSVGWLLYSSVTGNYRPAGKYVHTCLARTTDHGRTWTYVGRINTSADGTLDLGDGRKLDGVWRYEVSTLVRDDGAPEGDWKLFVHKYFWSPQKDRMFAYGWIAMRTAHDPAGPWSEEVPLFGAGRNPPAPYHHTQVDVNALSPDLSHQVTYSEMGSLCHDGSLYLSLGAMWFLGPDKIVLLRSRDHARTWEFVHTLVTRDDAKALGYSWLDGSSLAADHGHFFLLVTPGSRKLMHDGTLAFEFDSLENGTLKRDSAGHPTIATYFPVQSSLLSGPGGGQSDYDEHNTGGGLLMPQFDLRAYPHVFQIFSTGRKLTAP
ncbi:hypothetical protein CfE428DRAFT_0633 [Chthoniobacter flavus Ellin428]|uniref:Exo-alpha-sialidase n=1 Tax=Chthoniobacter flavus Ellin428 TaxID=497964 RepID=B4CVE6_9BACT|nr:hypothetical protein [Chthoniobacter flavus]EDY21388.1 hypothetical protein CfE428DRAFT_0633 [Chthoniobacter flavus Ellin428]TCO95351.1 hypothetical protein EV701_10137 [Chthoniobacter flavus]